MIKIKKLHWEIWSGHFGNSHLARVDGLNKSYNIWIDRDTGKTITAGLDNKKREFDSVESAKEWCQKNLEEIILNLIE